MAEEIVKFDPSKLVDQVRERIQNTFAELIPEEEWKKLVQREIDEFLKPRRVTKNSWGNEVFEEGSFARLINAELSAMLKKLIADELATEKWHPWWKRAEASDRQGARGADREKRAGDLGADDRAVHFANDDAEVNDAAPHVPRRLRRATRQRRMVSEMLLPSLRAEHGVPRGERRGVRSAEGGRTDAAWAVPRGDVTFTRRRV